MAFELSQIGTLLGSSTATNSPRLYDLVNGVRQGVNTSLLSGLAPQPASTLTDLQTTALANLGAFVQENISGPDAEKLFKSIAALEKFMEFGNEASASLDPVFSLLLANPAIIEDVPSGTLVNQLL